MKFTILSHAAMLVESGDVRLVTDPWLLGSCYWRSWWNYPPPADIVNDLRATHVYITHLHWDHFHSPSLERCISPATKFFVPQASFPRMVDDLAQCGYTNVEEIPHGGSVRAGDLTLTSYQFGIPLDSCLVIDDGVTTLVDANDCKLMAGPLRQLARRHPKVDFVFRSHSSANPYPACLRTDNPAWLRVREKDDYMAEFVAFTEVLGAKYGVPFASNHCFMHRDTWQFNDTCVSPEMVREYFDAHKRTTAECAVMVPGDSWSRANGFNVQQHDWFTNRPQRLDEYRNRIADKLDETYRKEEHVRDKLPWKAFEKYFGDMVRSLPWFTRWVFGKRICFRVMSTTPQYWLVDFKRRAVEDHGPNQPSCDVLLEMPTVILRDCVGKKMFSTLSASKRMMIEIPEGTLEDALRFDTLRDLYECDYFPMRKMFSRRFIGNWLRRWREAWFYVVMLLKVKVLKQPINVVRLIEDGSPQAKPLHHDPTATPDVTADKTLAATMADEH